MLDDDEDEDKQKKSNVCVDCRVLSPRTETNYTLISSKYGWRLSRSEGPNGTVILEWRCPACWTRFRARRPSILPPR